MLTPDKAYLIIAIDNKESTTAVLEGKKYRIIDRAHSTVPGKIKAGGQSAHRYEHLRLDAANDFYHRIAEHINKEVVPYIEKINGVVLGGPGATKKDFFEKEYLDYRIRDKTIGFLDVTYTDESGIREIIDAAQDLLRETEIVIEKQAISEFFKAAIKSSLAAYGFDDVISALKGNRAAKVLVSEGLNKEIKVAECLSCNKSRILFDEKDSKKCECGGDIEEIETLSLAEYVTELSEKSSTEVVIISTDTDEGEQFLNAFGGIGAILRY
jgi:peptide chain release factor subunit 1